MARGLNKVMLIGNLGADPEIKYAASGTAIANVRIATSERRKNQSGEWEDMTEWHRVVFFGKSAETAKDYLKKGSRVYVEGRIQTRSWDDQNGNRQYMTEIVGFQMLMLDSPDSPGGRGPAPQGRQGGQPQQQRRQQTSQPPQPPADFPEQDDDLPF